MQYVTFHYGNDMSSRRETIVKGETVSAPAAPAWQGFAFRGWYTSDGNAYDFSSPVNDDVVLTAKGAASYIDTDGTEQWLEPNEYTSASNNQWISGWYVVTGNDTVYSNIQLFGDVKLLLADGLTLRAMRGIYVPGTTSLTVYGQSGGTGKLIATGDDIYNDTGLAISYAGIGGSWDENESAQNNGHFGNITVNGGNIEATGCDDVPANGHMFAYTPGIGGTADSINANTTQKGKITVNGGTVKAYGAFGQAGITGTTLQVSSDSPPSGFPWRPTSTKTIPFSSPPT